jgi:hypothetical protein
VEITARLALAMRLSTVLINAPNQSGTNSHSEIKRRVESGQITWLRPLLVVTGRSVFFILAQAVVAVIFVLLHHPSPWRAAAPWWSVYGTLADLGCLVLMAIFSRKEGLRLRDLVGTIRWRWGWDLFFGLGLLLLVFPFFAITAKPSSLIAFGSPSPNLYPGLLAVRTLPAWAVVYSVSVWLLIWSPTEEMTYQGYALPRIYALSGHGSVAVLLVSFWWALQHSFIPLILDWHYLLWRFLAFWPAMVVMTLIYLWIRRLAPLIVTHWILDLSAVLITLKL